MIVLDTNILSEPLKPEPNLSVLRWLDNQPIGSLYITATVLSEIMFGVERLADGKRKDKFRSDAEKLIQHYFSTRILPFDANAARLYATKVAQALSNGKSVQVSDGQIAAVALSHNYAVATRDVAPFEAMGVTVINPWEP
jgi:toxin FitB